MIENALKSLFGMECKVSQIQLKGLPIYLIAGRKLAQVCTEDITFLLVFLSEKDKFGAVALAKQIVLYQQNSGLDVAFYFERLTKVQRDALIKHRIPFFSVPDQIYLPFLGIAIKNNFKKNHIVSVDKMMPVTQSLFLYLLYNQEYDYILKKQAAEKLGLTRTSITRASEQLKQMGLITELNCGKEVHMSTPFCGLELFEKAKPYLINPIQKRICISEKDKPENILVAGESALSMGSMLGAPREITYAIYKKEDIIKSWSEIDPKWQTDEPVCYVELWKYDPVVFARNGSVDPVSLAMSLRDDEDERVQGELQTYLEEYKW